MNGGSSVNGSIPGSNPTDEILVEFDSNGLADSTYNADIVITSNDTDDSPYTVPTTLIITSAPTPPTSVVFADNPDDNGGLILLTYTVSIDDPFYIGTGGNCAEVTDYSVYRSIDPVPSADTTWTVIDNWEPESTGSNYRTRLISSIGSDSIYAYRICSVFNPSKTKNSADKIVGKHIRSFQSEWVYGSAAARDNLPAYADMKVFLEGPYIAGGTMNNYGLTLPTISPYNSEDIGALPTVVDRTLIDWIYIELRTTETGETVKEANAFVLDNGMIVNTEGNHNLPFYYTTDIEYYIVIHHRNHLGIMSAITYTFGDFANQATSIDLTTSGSVWDEGFKQVETDVYAMYAGDANNNGQIQTSDKNDYWNVQVGQAGYIESDFNLNGQVQTSDVNDKWQYNVGASSKVPY